MSFFPRLPFQLFQVAADKPFIFSIRFRIESHSSHSYLQVLFHLFDEAQTSHIMSIIHRIMSLEPPFFRHRPAPMVPSPPPLPSSFTMASKTQSNMASTTQSIMASTTQSITFETLPVEIRLQIYKPIIADILNPPPRCQISVYNSRRSIRSRELAIMRVSKKIHLEFKDALWSSLDLTVELTKQIHTAVDLYDVQILDSIRRRRTPFPLGPFWPKLPIRNLTVKIDINPVFMEEAGRSLYFQRGMAWRDVPALNCALFKRKVLTLVSMLRMVPKIHRMHIQFCDLRKYGEYQGIKYLLKTLPEEVFESVDEILEIFEEGGFEEEVEREDFEGDEWEAFEQALARPLPYSRVEKK
jgi:hypothetical protein